MLTFLGFAMVVTFMTLIMTKRLSPLVALIIVPIAFALLGGFYAEVGGFMLDGIRKIAPTGVLLMFAILYFGLMLDAGLFDPLINGMLKLVRGDPLKVVIGTAILALGVSLDGDGSTTYMITVSAMLPLYRKLGLRPLVMACVIMLSSGVMNILPWGGPTSRAAAVLHLDVGDVFVPMIPAMIVGAIGVILISVWMGLRERARIGRIDFVGNKAGTGGMAMAGAGAAAGAAGAAGTYAGGSGATVARPPVDDDASRNTEEDALQSETEAAKRPKLIWVNAVLTVGLMIALIYGVLPLPVLFMIGFAIALLINYPGMKAQRDRIASHADSVLAVVAVIFAAGIFTGILAGTGMIEAMAKSALALLPPALGPYLAPITAVLSLPFTFFLSNDAFYYGVVPIIAQVAGNYGISPVEIARASLVGQPVHLLSPLVPSTYLLVALAGVEFGDHQKFTIKWGILICALMLVAGLVFGIFPLIGG